MALNDWIKQEWKYLLILVLLAVLPFAGALFSSSNLIYSPYSDYLAGTYFFRLVHNEQLANHQSFTWSNYNLGYPFLDFTTPYYPFEFLLILADYISGIDYIFHILLAAIGVYLFSRLIGISSFGSLASSIIFSFSTKIFAHIYAGHITIIYVLSYFPISLYLVELLVRNIVSSKNKDAVIISLLLAISLSLQILASHMQIFVYNFFFLGAYFLYRILLVEGAFKINLLKKRQLLFKSLSFFICLTAVALIISSVHLGIVYQMLNYHTRGDGTSLSFSSTTSLSFFDLVSFITPTIFGPPETYWGLAGNFWEGSVYLGLLPLVLAILAIILLRNKYTPFLIFTCVFSLLYSFGTNTPFYDIIRTIIIPFNFFRAPARMMFYLSFSFAILAAFALDYLLIKSTKKREEIKKLALSSFINKCLISVLSLSALVIAISLVFKDKILAIGAKIASYFYYVKFPDSEVIHKFTFDYYLKLIPSAFANIQANIICLVILLMLLILFFWFYHANIKKLSGKYTQPIQFFILFIIIIDLAYLDISLINFKDKEDIFYKTDLINYLESDKDKFRILDLAEAMPFFEKYGTNSYPLETLDVGFAKFDGLRSTNAIGRLIIDIPNNKIANFELLNLINVKYIILPYSLEKEGYSLVYHSTIYPLNIWGKENVNSEIFVYRNEKFLPRAFIVHAYHLETKTNMLSIMNASTSFREVVLLDEKPEINYTSKAACQTNVSIISISSTRAVFDTCLSEPGFLVFTDSYYPGWKAYIDGKETKVYRANYAFKAVVADAGQHEIIFEFKPTLFSKLSYLSIISFSLVILLLLVLIFRRKIK